MNPTDFAKRFYRLKDVIRVTTLSRSTIYRYMYEGLFPKQIEIAPRIVVWLESDVQKWMSEKIEMQKEQHYQNLRDDMRGVVSGIVSAPAWICREIDLEEGANWFLVIATCLDLIHSNKEGKIITKYTDHFHNNLG